TTVTIQGSNFVPGVQAQWNGKNRPTTFVTSGRLLMELSGADLMAPLSASVQVVNPAPGGGPSNVVTFNVAALGQNLLPSLTQITALTHNSNGTVTLTLAGGGFMAGTQARWNGASRATTFLSATQLRMTISATDFSSGSGVITVVNPAPGGGVSN